jgi:hypothetical protein
VPGYDRSRRYPPRGVWFGLVLAAISLRAVAAQDGLDEATRRKLNDPVALAADRVSHWNGPDGHWVHLWGNVSVLHGSEPVVRAREAVVRISDQSMEFETIKLVEVYAEGVARPAREDLPPSQTTGRAAVRTSVIRLNSFGPTGPSEIKNPPWQLQIIKRSGLREKKPARPASVRREKDHESSSIDSHLEALTQRGVTRKAGSSAATRQAVPIIPTQAIVRNQSDDPVPTLLPSPDVKPGRPATTAQSSQPVPKRDAMVQRAGASGGRLAGVGSQAPGAARTADAQVEQTALQQAPTTNTEPPRIDLPPIEGAPEVQVPNLTPGQQNRPPVDLQPLPGVEGGVTVPALPDQPRTEVEDRPEPELPIVPIMPGSQRVTRIFSRSGQPLDLRSLGTTPDGVEIYIIRNGVNIVTQAPKFGIIDIEADSAIIWRGKSPAKGEPYKAPAGDLFIDDAHQPMEVYLEGNVVLRQDENKYAGKGDQRTVRAPQLYYDFLTDRMLAPHGDIDMFVPSMMAPMRLSSPRIEQFRRPVMLPNGTFTLAEDPEIRLPNAIMTGSRFPNPGYSISAKTMDLTKTTRPLTNPDTGQEDNDPDKPAPAKEEQVWHLDARQVFYWGGPIPMFFWPRINQDLDDEQPVLRMIGFNSVNYFGQYVTTDWNGFRLLGMRRPRNVDVWNIDVDYLSKRTKNFPALGSEAGWYGSDLIRDLQDPYREKPIGPDHITQNYWGFFDIYGMQDEGIDVLGTGPAIVTNGPIGAGKAGFQRSSDPPFQADRERLTFRHNQRFLPEDDDHLFEELRVQVEVGDASDRNFIEEYFKRLFDTGMDQETLAYGIWQKDNQVATLWTEGNLQNWVTDTQWLPRGDYYRLGDSFFNNLFSYFQHSGADYAVTHTDIMVNNPNLFAFIPFDPISNTTGTFSAGRFYTNHELDMPLNLGNVFRVVPYVQGQLVGWSDQLGGGPLGHLPTGAMGRVWGGAGVRTEFTAYKQYSDVESDLWNVHGLNNKISLFTDSRLAWSNQKLNSIAVQDDLDDNTYEYVRRYLALTSFTGGLLPFPYDPRHLLLRQTLSPITGTTDIQGSIDTVQLGIHQRLQTKRGAVGKRRIVDYMTLDASTTYFPYSQRDNFGTPWGQTMYNWQWYIGDRTSIVSSGWFEFFKLVGSTPLNNNMTTGYNPNGLNIITSGISISRPPRANLYFGYSIIDTGPIKTSAANVSISYWLSPKWYGSYSTSYDFGDAVLLGTMFSFTRIGADYLTTIGLAVDPQRMNAYTFAVQIVPRIGGMRSGASSGSGQVDTRFAPTQ